MVKTTAQEYRKFTRVSFVSEATGHGLILEQEGKRNEVYRGATKLGPIRIGEHNLSLQYHNILTLFNSVLRW